MFSFFPFNIILLKKSIPAYEPWVGTQDSSIIYDFAQKASEEPAPSVYIRIRNFNLSTSFLNLMVTKIFSQLYIFNKIIKTFKPCNSDFTYIISVQLSALNCQQIPPTSLYISDRFNFLGYHGFLNPPVTFKTWQTEKNNTEQDLGLQCQTSIRLKVVVKSI